MKFHIMVRKNQENPATIFLYITLKLRLQNFDLRM